MVDEVTHDHRPGLGCLAVSRLALQAPSGCHGAFGVQGSQFSSADWQSFLKANYLEGSMSRRSDGHDNAVAESFFQLLKRERIKRRVYSTREVARSDVFDYIEMFCNSRRFHGTSDGLSPIEYEWRYTQSLTGV